MAGDLQNGAMESKKGLDANEYNTLHISLIDLGVSGKPKNSEPEVAPSNFPLKAADATIPPAAGLNGRHTGPVEQNPYRTRGGGVATAFQLPNGSRPQDKIEPATAPNWNDPVAQEKRKKGIDELVERNQQNVHKVTAGMGKGKPVDPGHSADGEQVHHIGTLGIAFGVLPAALYGQVGHPFLQRIAVPAQLKADALAEAGELPVKNAILNYPRKAYLEAFSPTYGAEKELKRVLPIETAAKLHLVEVKSIAEENVEALKMNAKDIADLKKVAGAKPTSTGGIAEAERAQRQLDYLDRRKASGISIRTALADETKKIGFLTKNEKFLAGGTVAEKDAICLNWAGFTKSMQELNVFSTADMKPVADIAAKEEPYVSIAGRMMNRGDLETITRAAEAGKGFWNTQWRLGAKVGISSGIIGAEAYGQSALAQAIGEEHPDAARIIEPTVPGTFMKASALILSPSNKMRAITYTGAQLYEAESNMTQPERLITMGVAALPAVYAFAKGDKPLATALAVADFTIGAFAELSADCFYPNDTSVTKAAAAIKQVASDPDDLSHSTLTKDVSALKDAAKDDPFLLTRLYDAAHAEDKAVKSNDSIVAQKAKYKNQMIMGQAQGETIIENGLTQSQYMKMLNRKADIPDPADHKEEYRIAHDQHIDIGSQGARTLIGAIGSANLLQWASSKQPDSDDDIASVEKQKLQMKSQLNDLFNKPHPHQIENALKDSGWHFGSTIGDYDLTEFWKHNIRDFDGIDRTIRGTANYWAGQLPTLQAKAEQAKEARDLALTQPASATDAAQKEHLYQARRDAAGLTQMWVGKLYRDEALMKIGQIQYLLEDSHAGHTVEPRDIKAQLDLAAVALINSKKYAPNNPDEAQLETITAEMYRSQQLVPATDFQANH